MHPIPENQQQALVSRLMNACGGAYSPETRRKHFISGPQWAAAYQGQALFHAPTRPAIGFEAVIRKYAEIGIGYWTTHDTDVIPTEALGKDQQAEIVSRIGKSLADNGLKCSMVTTETFYHAVWAASPAAEDPGVRQYAKFRVRNTVDIGHELGAAFAVYWPGSLGYYVQGAIEETETLRWYAESINAACDCDIEVAGLRSHGYNGPFNLDYKPPRTTSQFGVFEVSFPTAVDRFITLWEMAGEVLSDTIIREATDALKAGGQAADPRDADALASANRELLTLHELIAHRLVQILLGLHRGRVFSIA